MANDFEDAARRCVEKLKTDLLEFQLEPFRAPVVAPGDYQAADGVWVTARLLPGVRVGVHFEPLHAQEK